MLFTLKIVGGLLLPLPALLLLIGIGIAVMVQPLSAYREAMREPRLAAADAAEPAARGRQPAETD